MNENRQIFVNTYLTNGYNAKQAYKTAYPNCHGGWAKLGSRLMTFDDVKNAIIKAKTELNDWLKGRRELCDRLFGERYAACVSKNDNTNAIRCIENKAKNVGYYALDNEQRVEKREMDERQLVEARRIALVLLTMFPEAIQVDSKVIEGEKDVQGQGQGQTKGKSQCIY